MTESHPNEPALAEAKILDVGCGWNKTPGAIGIDANPRAHADVVHDLGSIPYPFANDEFDDVICRHVAEHVPDVMAFVAELHRITKPGGRILIVTPHYSNPDWATDPTHRTLYAATGSYDASRRKTQAGSHLRFARECLAGDWFGDARQSRSALAEA